MRCSVSVVPLAVVCALAPLPARAQTRTAIPAAATVAAADTVGATPSPAAAAPIAAPPPFAGLKISGYAEASYAWSSAPTGGAIAGRLYDRFHDAFTLNALKVAVDRPFATDRFDAGFHADVVLGQNAAVIQSSGLKLGEQADLMQLYVTLNAPTPNGNGLQLKFGKIATLLGLEVLDAPLNPNWSEGYLFNFVENYTALGASAEYKFNRYADVQLRLIDGWDVVQDNNGGRSVMARVGLYPDSLSSVGLVAYVGPEAPASSAKRYGGEVLLYRKLSSRVGAWLQGDWGREEKLVPTASGSGPLGAANWWGAGAWLAVDVLPSLGVALRGELVDDRHGVRSNGWLFPSFAEGPGTRHRFGSGTATLNVRTWSNVLVRPEVRFDRSNLRLFNGTKSQTTAALGVAYLY